MKYLLILLFLSPAVSFAQKINPDTLSFVYGGIEQVENIPARILQSRAGLYMKDLNVLKVVTKVDDLDGSVLLFDVYQNLYIQEYSDARFDSTNLGELNFTIKIVCKDGKYKYTCYAVNQQSGNTNVATAGWLTNTKPASGTFYMSMTKWREAKLSSNQYILNLLKGLLEAMQSDEINPDRPDF